MSAEVMPCGLRQAPHVGPRRTRKSRGDLAGLLASLPHSFLPGPAGWLRSRETVSLRRRRGAAAVPTGPPGGARAGGGSLRGVGLVEGGRAG